MAPKTKTPSTTKTKTKATKPAPAPEVEEVDEEETTTASATDVTFGAADLAAHIAEKTGKTVTTRELRTLLRKMARDGRINREIIPGNRARYDWSGPNDPEVKAVVKAFESGELEEDKQAKLQALKDRKAEQNAAKKAAEEKAETKGKGKGKGKAKPAAPVEEDDEDLELEDDGDDE